MKWLIAALVFGMLAVSFGLASLASWDALQSAGTQFIASQIGRPGVTTLDHTLILAVATLVCGVSCLGSIVALFSSRDSKPNDSRGDDPKEFGGDGWTCAVCHESNPGNFQACWRCQRDRPPRKRPV